MSGLEKAVYGTSAERECARYLSETMRTGHNLMIIAPAHKLNTKDMRIENGILMNPLKDPIVLQPVHNGYLIVTLWRGDEPKELFEEPAVRNEKLN